MATSALALYLARHGETDDNVRLVFQGQGGRGLNRRGRAQAERLGARLAKVGLGAIVSSDLERAVETARIVGRRCGSEPTLDPDLREVDLGRWTGMSHEEVGELYPEEWAAWSAGLDLARGGGETYAALAERVERAIARIGPTDDGRPVLVVSHGGSIKSYLTKILGLDPKRSRVLARVANAGLTLIERDSRGRVRLESWNDTSHLDGLD